MSEIEYYKKNNDVDIEIFWCFENYLTGATMKVKDGELLPSRLEGWFPMSAYDYYLLHKKIYKSND